MKYMFSDLPLSLENGRRFLPSRGLILVLNAQLMESCNQSSSTPHIFHFSLITDNVWANRATVDAILFQHFPVNGYEFSEEASGAESCVSC